MTTPLHRPNPGDDERGPLPGDLYLPQLRPERSKCEVCGESTGSVHGKRCRRCATAYISGSTAPPPEHTDEDAP